MTQISLTAAHVAPQARADWRRIVLRSNAIYLMLAAASALFFADLPGIYLGQGPVSALFGGQAYAGIGFVEAHGLAFILGVMFFRCTPARFWFASAMSVELLLGGCNLLFWQIFEATASLPAGYALTTFHWLFAGAQLVAAVTAPSTVR